MKTATFYFVSICLIFILLINRSEVSAQNHNTQGRYLSNHLENTQNYLNPFNPSTKNRLTISELRFTILNVYDVLGNEIATLVNEEKPAGSYEVEFNPVSGIRYPASGIYFYQLKAGEYIQTKKMILMR